MSNCIIKIPTALYERLKALAGKQGYSSAEEMINHILEKAVDGVSADCSAPRPARRSYPSEEGCGADSSAIVSAKTDVSGVALSAAEGAETDVSGVALAETESIKRQLKGLGYFNG